MKTIAVSFEDYQDAVDSYQGWCPVCQSFTRDTTEPDAEGYNCPVCGEHKVVGAEQALLLGMIEPDMPEF
ncbi:MAG: hypothetical protein Q8O83_02165 [bacterium]|nr:hypothetical protein [bacterium]